METIKSERQWERTNVTNLLRNRQSGKYYVYVKAHGKQKWRPLKTKVFSVTNPRLRRDGLQVALILKYPT